ncbi:hypothetical protein [Bradyrhizobium vignae]|uniref:hypothetical protein n=1 Tax=Bradyrhizobium vignae TaxID=1549949 RepID=UPI00142ED692|nr:hypothetical protein [Bradyrhizobium vignae]
MAEAYVIDVVRTPHGVGKPGKGALSHLHPQHLAATVPTALKERNKLDTSTLTMITDGYFNGEDVRLNGAIRMAPR